MHDIGALIWVIIVIAGVISSIYRSARNARRAAAEGQQAPPSRPVRTQPRYVRPVPPPPWPRGAVPPPAIPPAAGAVPAMPPIATAPPVQRPARVPQTPRAVTVPVTPPAAQHPQSVAHPQPQAGVLRGLFEDRKGLVRAVVAAEVLGPPLALREQSIWSPLHNEPSI